MTASTSATSTICARSVRRIQLSRRRFNAASGVPSIPEAVDSVDGGELRIYRLELAPDALHVRGDGRVVDHDVRIAHQALAILDVARIARERVHEPELGQREIDRRLTPGRLEALHVEAQRPALERLLGGGRLAQEIGAAKEGADARE